MARPLSGPLRVALVSSAYLPYPSGVSEHVASLARALAHAGHHPEVVTTRFGGPAENGADSLVPVHRLGRAVRIPGNGSFATLPVGAGLSGQVERLLAQRRFDVVHCHGFAFPELAYWGITRTSSARVVSLMSAGFAAPEAAGRLYRALFGRSLARVAAVTALSRWAAECHRAFFPGEVRIVPSGVDLERFAPPPGAGPTRGPGRSVLFLGRLDRRKGLDVLLAAFPEVLASVPDCRLVVVGDGPGAADARRQAASLSVAGAVEFAGRVGRREVALRFGAASVFASPARGGESFGIVLLEAMAGGTPVVAADIGGYREVVRDGIDGLLVPAGDVPALSSALIRVLREPELASRLSAAGLRRAAEFAWPKVAAATLEVYADALDAHIRSSTSP